MAASRQLTAIMFTDVAGFTELAQADEKGALGLLEELDTMAAPLIERHHGRKVKAIGDGLLVEFPDALNAVECAVELQTSLHERNAREGHRPLRLRVGLHLGDVERRGSDILGDAVNLASRVEALADPGGICLSEHVTAQVRNKLPYRFEALGPRSLKGIHEPVGIYRVALPWTVGAPGPSPAGPPRIAVLPFANISPDPKDEYFADGLTEELITVLSRLHGLRVIARTSVSSYKTAPKPIRQIGSELGVGAILEGSVRRAGDRLRITLQLIDVASEEHRWAESYDRNLSDVFEIQADIAERTARALQVELLGSERAAVRKPPVRDVGAYELYLRGIAGFQRVADEGWPREGTEGVARSFEASIAKDPSSASARAYLANLYIAAMGECLPKSEVAGKIKDLMDEALRLEPDAPEVRTARGNYALQIERDWSRAEKEFRSAIALTPSATWAHAWLGILLVTLGRYEESVHELQAARELDPLFTNLTEWQIRATAHAGDLPGAIALARQVLELSPGNRQLRVQLAALLLRQGRREDAAREAALASGPLGGAGTATSRAELGVALGDPSEARALVEAWERKSGSEYIRPNYIAALYAVLGDKERALEILEHDTKEGEQTLWIDFRRHAFDSIRDTPRFRALLREMNLPA